MIDIPGVYVGRFKTDPNNRPALMTRANIPTYTDDNWANVESTGTIWRYNAETGEWVDTGLEEILVEEVTGTKEIVAEGTVPWNFQGLKVYGKSTQASTTGAQLFDGGPFTVLVGASSSGFCYAPQSVVDTIKSLPNGTYSVSYTPVGSGIAGSEIGKISLYAGESAIPGYNQITTVEINDDVKAIVSAVAIYGYLNQKNQVNDFMLNAGAIALPWEPYTGGKPSPSPDYPQEIHSAGESGSIAVTVSNGADQSQQLSISTPNGLPGIPVDSGGNYTDAAGQQWVCDEVDYARGVYVQRTKYARLPGSGYTSDIEISEKRYLIKVSQIFGVITNKRHPIITTVAKTLNPISQSVQGQIFQYAGNVHWYCTDYFSSLEELNTFLDENEVMIVGQLKAPIETPLSDEELSAYASLMSYDGTTVISTDEDISGMSAKVVTDVIEKNSWFDPYSELALYYKALAGFASLEDLPMPHSRESSLVRKLLDSSYELGFTVTENSSRNERYLWDLINGTTSMLTNVPKSDTEKFLHVMIGGTVEKYPTIDTELDYWMDKCVHYMNTNGSIGE